MSDWVFSQLGGFVVHTKGYAFKSKDYQDKGVPIIKVKNFTADSIDLSDVDYLSFEQKDEYEKVRLNYNDVVIATVGSWLTNPNSVVGKTVKVPRNVSGSLLNQNAVRLKAKEGLDQTFLFYLLKSNSFKYYIVGTAQGSANQASITLNDIFNYEFSKPLIPEQKAIAHILGKLDDKIELNRQMNQTLEAMAQALFKSWFVDFDPVIDNALAAGHEIPEALQFKAEKRKKLSSLEGGVPEGRGGRLLDTNPELAALFPSSFVFSETLNKWIPEGWEVKKLEEICKIKTGFPFKSKEYSFGEGVKVVRGENVSLGFLRWDTLKTWDKDTSHLDDYWLSEYDILIGMDGSRVGRNRSFVYKHELPMLLAQRVAALSSIEEVGHSFLGQLILGDPFFRYVENVKTGTSIPHISAKQIKTFEVLLPSNNLAKNFSNHLKPTLEKQSEMIRETETLTQLRDTLLPQLISGKVRVPEEMVEKVGVQEKQNF